MKDHVEQLFHAVVDLSEKDRARYFEEHNAGPDTRREVEELLSFDSNTSPALMADIGLMAAEAVATPSPAPADMRCGPYLPGELLGRGGMGAVYLAHRVDGEVTQKVAVKVLRSGAGGDPLVLERFLAERQIQANLSHPNVARLLDAGHREDGQPYLVMEYVEGKPLDVYAAHLGTREKIELFIKVCGAVGYLHRNLIVHRDLKPANILVTAAGEPKLVDFGIAKILDFATGQTATHLRMLTPDYASPEQITGRPVSTASDIYSLGAVLYRLLTGEAPHRFKKDGGDLAVQITTGKITPPSSLAPDLKGDLEAVLLKALRPEPQERYATVDQLAEDLENFLASLPVRARRGDTWYRTRKVLTRHWVLATAAILVLGSLSAGLWIANRERMLAERRFSQLRQLSKRVIDLDGSIRALPGSVAARQRLVEASLEYLEGLRREAGNNPDLAQEVADGYWRMARIQGINTEFNLGDSAKAQDSLKKADALIDGVLRMRPDNRNALLRSAVIAHDRMTVAASEDRKDEALELAHRTVVRVEQVLKTEPTGDSIQFDGFISSGSGQYALRERLAGLIGNVALAYVNLHEYAQGAVYARRAVEIGETAPWPTGLAAQVQGYGVLANAQRYEGNLEAALVSIRKARELVNTGKYPNESGRFFTLYGVLLREGLILGEAEAANLNRPAEAAAVLEEALQLTDGAAQKDQHDSASRARVGTVSRVLGSILSDRDPRRAVAVFDLGIQRLSEAGPGLVTRRERAGLLAKSAAPLRSLGRQKEADARIEAALQILTEAHDYPSERIRLSSAVWTALEARSDNEAAHGDMQTAIATREHLLAAVMATKSDVLTDLRDTPRLSHMYKAMALLYSRAGQPEKAAGFDGKRRELWQHWDQKLPKNPFIARELDDARQGAKKISQNSKIPQRNAQASFRGALWK